MSNNIEAAVKPIGRELWRIVREQGIKSLDVWTTQEPDTVTVQYTNSEGALVIAYLKSKGD